MNKTQIEWCDSTWNPVTGCFHSCEYCYARRIANRFSYYHGDGSLHFLGEPITIPETAVRDARVNQFPYGFDPTFRRYRLDEPQRIKKSKTIFVCSMADLFGRWVPDKWIDEVFIACERAPQHRYLFLTKYPERYEELRCMNKLPAKNNFWYGTTITEPTAAYWSNDKFNTFLSIEPLMEPFGKSAKDFARPMEPRWYILGAMTGPSSKQHQPEKGWVDEIVAAAKARNAAIFMKDSLLPIMGEENMRRELPWEENL